MHNDSFLSKYDVLFQIAECLEGHRGRDYMLVRFRSFYAIGAYHR